MFSVIRSGTTGRNGEIRYNLLSYTTAMRHNLDAGLPIFDKVCKPEDDPTKAGELTTEELGSRDEQLRKNAALAEIFAKELSFLNRTIQMITLVASRYYEEKEDEAAAAEFNDDGHDDDDIDSDSDSDIEANYDDDDAPSMFPMRSQSHAMTGGYNESNSNKSTFAGAAAVEPENPLCNMLLVGSGKLMQGFHKLCKDSGLDYVTVNAMTSADRPITLKTLHDRDQADFTCIQTLYERYRGFDNLNREDVVRNFQDLFELSKSAWSFMSLLAFSNLFRLTKGTDFEIAPINPDDAIFSNRGRPFRPHVSEAAIWPPFYQQFSNPAAAAAAAEADPTDYSDDVVASVIVCLAGTN